MPLTVGYIHNGGDALYVRVFYDATFTPGAGQTYSDAPLINNANPSLGPTGYCLLVVNTSGAKGVASVLSNTGAVLVDHVTIPLGNPVTTGAARSRTAATLATAGLRTRGDVGTVLFE